MNQKKRETEEKKRGKEGKKRKERWSDSREDGGRRG